VKKVIVLKTKLYGEVILTVDKNPTKVIISIYSGKEQIEITEKGIEITRRK